MNRSTTTTSSRLVDVVERAVFDSLCCAVHGAVGGKSRLKNCCCGSSETRVTEKSKLPLFDLLSGVE